MKPSHVAALAALSAMSTLLTGCQSPLSPKAKGKWDDRNEPDSDHTSKEWQIWAYSSAAPAYLSKDATVLDGKMKPLKKGTNGWTCMPANPNGPGKDGFKTAHEAMPICGDAASFAWAKAYFAKKKPEITEDGFMWMLHGDIGEDNKVPGHIGNKKWFKEHPENIIESGPHLMIMPKDGAAWSKPGIPTDFNAGGPYVMFSGTDYAHVMIPVEHYYDYQKQKLGKGKDQAPARLPEPSSDHTSKEWQIWAYSSAAPPFLAKDATVLDGKMTPLRKGTNGWTCMPGNPNGPGKDGFKNAHEAMAVCGDAESFKWVKAYFAKEEPKIERDGWMWMMNGDIGEDNKEPGHIGNQEYFKKHPENHIESGSHLMIMPKDAAAWSKDGVNTDFNIGGPYTMFSGSKYAHVMIPVMDYYHYQDQVAEDKKAELFTDFGNPLFENSEHSGTMFGAFLCVVLLALAVVIWRRKRSSKPEARDEHGSGSDGDKTDEETGILE